MFMSDDVKTAHQPLTGDDAVEESDLHDPQVTTPEDHDEESFSGSNPSLGSDDNIDKLGDEYLGTEYEDDEELDVGKKVHIETESEPPEK